MAGICRHPWRAGSCRNCPLNRARQQQPRTATGKGKKDIQDETDWSAVPGITAEYLSAMAALQRARRALPSEPQNEAQADLFARVDRRLAEFAEAREKGRALAEKGARVTRQR